MFLSGIDFTLDGSLIGAASEEVVNGFFRQISLIIDEGEPKVDATEIDGDLDIICNPENNFHPYLRRFSVMAEAMLN